jgi:hypothetical protein
MPDEYLPPDVAGALKFDRERLYPALNKIVRGLYFHHIGGRLEDSTDFRWYILDHPSKLDPQLAAMLARCQAGLTSQAVLAHLAKVAPEGCVFVVIDRLEQGGQFTNDVVATFVNAGFIRPTLHSFPVLWTATNVSPI